MVIILDGKTQKNTPRRIKDFYKAFPIYRESAKKFLSTGNKATGPKGLLYVGQCEFAASTPHDKNVIIIGSDDATTCIIIVVRHSVSGATALAHFDGSDIEETVPKLIQRVQELTADNCEGIIELHLVGGYSDERFYSEKIFYSIMSAFHSHSSEVHVTLVCVGDLNTIVRNGMPWPITYGTGIELKTGDIFPATFPERGPDENVRHARLYSFGKVLEIYDSKKGLLKIGPFRYELSLNIDFLLAQGDINLLQYLSTSPSVEPPHYVQQTRNSLVFLKDNPNPAKVFKNGQPHYFKRNEDCSIWVPVVI